ncbi:PIN domain-containing protein [Marinobacter nauticus]|uniref:PIN domain-containing protein n=1 Tax=Marinobacter nauticus TaxID=2743 RepID=UPI00112FBF3D|nr:PIN domain-containing protein [Marinobacter nauticus]TPW23420.1 PIN domain-containing protein [Marinobacter nauticus]
MAESFLVDASFLVPAIRSSHEFHLPCYTFAEDHRDAKWIIPNLAIFEFQATQSRRNRGDNDSREPYRHIYWENAVPYEVGPELTKKAWELDLFNRFDRLKGADLVYACIAKIENVPLVTRDNDFSRYSEEITIINPVTDSDF